jgi:hypothetical protein
MSFSERGSLYVLGFWVSLFNSQSKSSCCRAAGVRIGDLRALGSASPIEQSDLRAWVSINGCYDPILSQFPMVCRIFGHLCFWN